MLHELAHPIVGAPLAGGPSTPALAAAVSEAGGLGFLAAGYLGVDAVRAEVADVRARTARPFGVNVFAPPEPDGDPAAVHRYAQALGVEAERYGVALGEPRRDDDGFHAKLELLAEERVPVVSFTFGLPASEVIGELRRGGTHVWVTVTTPEEAIAADAAGADALVVQGVEAGGHRGSFDDAAPGDVGLLALLQLVGAAVDIPLVAAGGIVNARGVAAVLAGGASAAQLGTALLLTAEAGTSPPHRDALRGEASTALTRAFSGRTARGIVNRFLRKHDAEAPTAYPEVHHLTAPLRAAARERGDADGVNLWAGQAYRLAEEVPAAELVARLGDEARRMLAEAASRFSA
jgi:nitronate monooxygenase